MTTMRAFFPQMSNSIFISPKSITVIGASGKPGVGETIFTNIADAIAKFQSNIKQDWCACVDYSIPAFSMSPKIRQGYVAAKERGVRIRYVTEVTAENLAYCVDLMRFVELRHLDGVQGSFAVSETEFVAGIRGKKKIILAKLVYSNVKEVVEHEQDAFETLWKNAEPATVQIGNLQSKSLDS
jgi:hypothetical protein